MLRKIVVHVRNGTLGARILWSIQSTRTQFTRAIDARRYAKKTAFWEARVEQGAHVDVSIGRRAVLRLHPDSEVAKSIFLHEYERSERIFLQRFLRPGDCFVDIGANIGLFTVLAAATVGPSGTVLAFEPGSTSRRRLLENIELNRLTNVVVESRALSNRAESKGIHIPIDGHDAWGSFAAPIAGSTLVVETVETVRWDDLPGSNPSPTMIKIDVEGW